MVATLTRRKKPNRIKTNYVGLVQQIQLLSVDDIRPAPENDEIYRRIDPDDGELIKLAESIKNNGITDPLIVTNDGYIISGHRRYAAGKMVGFSQFPCQVKNFRRVDDINRFVKLLRECNRQREKTNGERLREELIDMSESKAYADLREYKRGKITVNAAPMVLAEKRKRRQVASGEMPFLDAVLKRLDDVRAYWPVSDRSIHYGLASLSEPPFLYVHPAGSKRALEMRRYANDPKSYKALTDLLTRARVQGLVPWEAIGDETRPVQTWCLHKTCMEFVNSEMGGFLRHVALDLQQSQSLHIEIIGEKLTVESSIKEVAMDFCIPYTIGRGYCSINPRHEMVERFLKSGREKLVVLVLSDLDPDGVVIGQSFIRSLRDDFGIEEEQLHAVRVALTPAQVRTHRLPKAIEARTTSKHYPAFKAKYGTIAYELDALPPAVLQQSLRDAIESIIDREAFDKDVALERKAAHSCAALRNVAMDAFSKIDLEVLE